MESALCIAIRSGKAEFVWALLEHGCNPNAPIRWQIAASVNTWTREHWDSKRWWLTRSFASALDFSLSAGGAAFNKRGANVVINNPSFSAQIYDWVEQSPDPDVIKVLLEHGAEVTDSCLETATKLANPQILAILHDHMRRHKDNESFMTGTTSYSSLSHLQRSSGEHRSSVERSLAPSPNLMPNSPPTHPTPSAVQVPALVNLIRSHSNSSLPNTGAFSYAHLSNPNIPSLQSISSISSGGSTTLAQKQSPKLSVSTLSMTHSPAVSLSVQTSSGPASPLDMSSLLSPSTWMGQDSTVYSSSGSGIFAQSSESHSPNVGPISSPRTTHSRTSSVTSSTMPPPSHSQSQSEQSSRTLTVDPTPLIAHLTQQLAEQVRANEEQRVKITKLTQENRELKEVVFKLMKEQERVRLMSGSSTSSSASGSPRHFGEGTARVLFPDSGSDTSPTSRGRFDQRAATFSGPGIGDKPQSTGGILSPSGGLSRQERGKRGSSRVRIQLPADEDPGPGQIAAMVENAFRIGAEELERGYASAAE
ncbi:hypothetical protein HDU93_007731 [Gonapodya sp. JEL0774]|nr:hypothetical protein HDU93_007731 [Gonapodya sp. JEL0774]